MKKSSIIMLGTVLPIAVLAGCTQNDAEKQIQPLAEVTDENQSTDAEVSSDNSTVENKEKTQAEIVQDTIDKQSQEIKELTKEVEYYKSFVRDITSTFTREEQAKFIEDEWSYRLTISDISFPKNGVLDLSNSSFEVVLSEERVPYSLIPAIASEEGKVSKTITDQVKFVTDNNISPKSKEALTETASNISYTFTDVPSGTKINVKITESLQKELGLDTPDLVINIK